MDELSINHTTGPDRVYHAVYMPDGRLAGSVTSPGPGTWFGLKPNGIRCAVADTMEACIEEVRHWKRHNDEWQDTLARMATDY